MPPRRPRSATVSLLSAALLVLGGAFLTTASGASTAEPQASSTPATARLTGRSDAYAVGVRQFSFARGAKRPLSTTVWYPTPGARRAKGRPKLDAPVVARRFPLLLWSHGLHSNPQEQESVTMAFAGAGFVVVAPAYPYTKKDTARFNKPDVANQPLDASHAISLMLEPANPLAAHIDPDRMAAAGHSAGGTTTNGLFTIHRDARLKAGIVVAGRPQGRYTGAPVPMLFLHGDHDPVVAYEQGRTAFAAVPWPKAFLTVHGGKHGAGLGDLERGHQQSMSTMLNFLRWALDGDGTARDRLPGDGTLAGTTSFESSGIYLSTSQPTTASSTTAATTAPTTNGSLLPVGSG